jgi:hypothetical protein
MFSTIMEIDNWILNSSVLVVQFVGFRFLYPPDPNFNCYCLCQFLWGLSTCQTWPLSLSHYPRLLQPHEVPPTAWHTIYMDFVTGLPKSGNVDCILLVVDKFSKYGHFLPLHRYTALSVAHLFLDNNLQLHGLLVAIISDRDPIFTIVGLSSCT